MTRQDQWWRKERHAARRSRLLQRGKVKSALRAWFEQAGFTEVECGILQVSPGNETHLHGFKAEWETLSGAPASRYLHTSPEFAAKKLLAAGEELIFDFARVFRGREAGPLNVPEFTMLEWYRVNASYTDVMADCAALLQTAAKVLGTYTVNFNQCLVDVTVQPDILSVADAFERFAEIDLLATLGPAGEPDALALAAALGKAGILVDPEESWSDMFSRVISERIEPNLGAKAPLFLVDYPLPEAALARRSERDPRLAERFELYVAGVELANGFSELTNAIEQRRRFEEDMEARERIYGARYPIDEDFLEALDAMPEASGVALGFDRLVMLLTGGACVNDVLWTPLDIGAT